MDGKHTPSPQPLKDKWSRLIGATTGALDWLTQGS